MEVYYYQNAEERLQQYQEQVFEVINKFPKAIEHLDWCDLTDGFDPNEVNFFITGIMKIEVLDKFIEVLQAQWEKKLTKPDKRMFVDKDTCDILRYGSENCPVRFSTFLEENRRMWIEREIDCLID